MRLTLRQRFRRFRHLQPAKLGGLDLSAVAGGYEDWARRRSPAKPASDAKPRMAATETRAQPATARKLTYKDQRDLDRLPGEIERIEQEIARAERALDDPDLYARDPARFRELTAAIAALRADKDAAEHRWLEVAELAEQIGA